MLSKFVNLSRKRFDLALESCKGVWRLLSSESEWWLSLVEVSQLCQPYQPYKSKTQLSSTAFSHISNAIAGKD